jgi:hypothetical protein
MPKEKVLTGLLHDLANLIAEESAHNSTFSTKLTNLLTPRLNGLPKKKVASKKPAITPSPALLPDIHAEWTARGETDFRLWLRDQPLPTLRAVISVEDLDAARRTTKWKETEKLANFIADSLLTRQSRGSAFMGRDSKEHAGVDKALANAEVNPTLQPQSDG